MTALGGETVTLLDFAKRVDPDGAHATVAEVLHNTNEIISDIPLLEANQPTSHRSTVRSGLPTPSWVGFNERSTPTKAETEQVTDSIGMLEDWSQVDARLVELNGNTLQFRTSEDIAHIEGISQEWAQTLFYGNHAVSPKEFTGLATRYSDVAGAYGDSIIDAGGTGSDNTSIWLVGWSPQTVYGIFPKGQAPGGAATGMNDDGSPQSIAGLKIEDEGKITSETSGGLMRVYRTHYGVQTGLVVKDWRYVVRVGSIDVSDLNTLENTKNLITWMIQASEKIPSFNGAKFCWYVNRTIREKLRLGIQEKIANNLTWESVGGKRVMMFDDIPVKRCDALINTEAQI